MFVVALILLWLSSFKQKTAYGVRISGWSPDVCSSDLPDRAFGQARLIVLLLLRQQAVFGPRFPQGAAEELVGGLVARLAQRGGAEQAAFPHIDQYASGHLGQMRGQ